MANCLKCGKYIESNETGYCDKCFQKLFKQNKNTTVKQRRNETIRNRIIIIIIILVLVTIGVFWKNTIISILNIAIDGSWEFSKVSFEPSLPSFIITDNSKTYNVRNEIITAENYDELSEKVAKELGEVDDIYYYSYAGMYYIAKDGLSNILENLNSEDDSYMYVNIYGKTVQQLIDEGKELMKENDITIEEYKEQLTELNNNVD